MLLERPSLWSIGAEVIAQAMNGNITTLYNSVQWPISDLERPAISCPDNVPSAFAPPPSAEEIIDEWLYVYENVTRFAFSVVATEQDSGCHFWPADPPERFNGPWNHTLRNPILVMSARVSTAIMMDAHRRNHLCRGIRSHPCKAQKMCRAY